MDIAKISAGKSVPETINVVIEIPQGGSPIKYEVCKDSGALLVDRMMSTAMYYPANYGFVPNTLSGDGDPVDVLVVTHSPIQSGAVVSSRPIGVLLMEDESGQDEKIIAVPMDKISPYTAHIKSTADLPPVLVEQIKHFFEHYKDLEKGKWVKIIRWGDAEEAKKLILEGVARLSSKAA